MCVYIYICMYIYIYIYVCMYTHTRKQSQNNLTKIKYSRLTQETKEIKKIYIYLPVKNKIN